MNLRLLWVAPVMALLVYLLLAPVRIDPVAWEPLPSPSLQAAPYAPNDRLAATQRIGETLQGPEAVALDAQGRLHTGLEDGRVLRIDPRDGRCQVLANTGGRPLGLQVLEDGSVAVADAKRGLLRVATDGSVSLLADHAEGIRLGFADDLVADSLGRLYFSDASWKFGYGEHVLDLLEHGGRGRLLRYQPDLGEAVTLFIGLQFANGVALGPDENYVLVNESGAYRITRFWLKTERAGTTDVFADNLPGFPDNLTFNGRDRFWVALYAPRNAMLDRLAPHPFWRRMVARLPSFLQPAPEPLAFIVGLDLDGRVVEQYRAQGAQAYAPITSVREHDGYLYLGSLSQKGIGRVSLSALRSGGQTPPAPAPLAVNCEG